MKIKERVYVFFGIYKGTEYVLNPLYRYMKELGYNCVELEVNENKQWYSIIKNLINKEIIFVTSAHLFFDNKNLEYIYNRENVISALELIDYLKPIKKIYYPHDLVNPILDYDMNFMSLFDVILSPLPYLNYLNAYSQVIEVGWIKKHKLIEHKNDLIRNELSIFFPLSSFSYFIKKGFDYTYNFWKPIFDLGVKVKLPYWQKSSEYEKYLSEKGIDIYSAQSNIFDILDKCDLVITNGDTSVNIESCLSGIPTINIIDGSVSSYTQKKLFYGLPGIKVLSMEESLIHINKIINDETKIQFNQDILKPFDFKKSVEIIIS